MIQGLAEGRRGKAVGCPVCKRLERIFEGWNAECIRARSSLYGTVSSRFAAYDIVEMERARTDLRMHRAVCAFVDTTPARLGPVLVPRPPQVPRRLAP